MRNVYVGDTFKVVTDEGMFELEIEQDNDSESPRAWDPCSTMYCWHREYSLGESHSFFDIRDVLESISKETGAKLDEEFFEMRPNEFIKGRDTRIIEALKDYACIKFLYLYDHSGIRISTSDFNDPWDSGVVGIVYITKEHALKEIGNADEVNWYELASQCIEDEVDTYDQYLSGEVYGFTLNKVETCACCGTVLKTFEDSMGGFYGSDILSNGMLDYLPEAFVKMFKEEK